MQRLASLFERKQTLTQIMADTDNKVKFEEGDPQNVQDLTGFVQTLLQQMQDKFQQMSDQIITRIDDMSTRIDDLERNIGELMNQAGVDEPEK
ncbi:heat shock factor-binding protein 1-like [Montipora capricornis]|uniref:heat shock factor-binding protein 1-like n=1 Tax=Montipora foliosa TaxID=591990 RepID=UPI0035F1E217